MYELKSGIFRILIFFQLNECIYEMCALMNENNIVRETLFLEKIYDTLSSYCQTCYLTRENMLHFLWKIHLYSGNLYQALHNTNTLTFFRYIPTELVWLYDPTFLKLKLLLHRYIYFLLKIAVIFNYNNITNRGEKITNFIKEASLLIL